MSTINTQNFAVQMFNACKDIGCTRGHPHENMSPACEAKTILARAAYENSIEAMKHRKAPSDLHKAVWDLIDSLEYVDRNYPGMTGYGVRALRIATAIHEMAREAQP